MSPKAGPSLVKEDGRVLSRRAQADIGYVSCSGNVQRPFDC
jgi:hypothetical protein